MWRDIRVAWATVDLDTVDAVLVYTLNMVLAGALCGLARTAYVWWSKNCAVPV